MTQPVGLLAVAVDTDDVIVPYADVPAGLEILDLKVFVLPALNPNALLPGEDGYGL
jgi:hypothetical protein